MSKEIEIVDPHKCMICGEFYGKTNLIFLGKTEVWIGCDCMPDDKAYFIDTTKIQVKLQQEGRSLVFVLM